MNITEGIASIAYHCPKNGVDRVVGPHDYEVFTRMEGEWPLRYPRIQAKVNCLCGDQHELAFGDDTDERPAKNL